MFICCNKALRIQEGDEVLELNRGFVGRIDDRWKGHWYIQAALRDGTITANEPQEEPKARVKKG